MCWHSVNNANQHFVFSKSMPTSLTLQHAHMPPSPIWIESPLSSFVYCVCFSPELPQCVLRQLQTSAFTKTTSVPLPQYIWRKGKRNRSERGGKRREGQGYFWETPLYFLCRFGIDFCLACCQEFWQRHIYFDQDLPLGHQVKHSSISSFLHLWSLCNIRTAIWRFSFSHKAWKMAPAIIRVRALCLTMILCEPPRFSAISVLGTFD